MKTLQIIITMIVLVFLMAFLLTSCSATRWDRATAKGWADAGRYPGYAVRQK
jgi:hypothetical protein